MSAFDNDIYNPKTGFQSRNFGKVRTVVGNVVNYSSNVTNEGSYECSIEIISRNTGLLEKKVEGDLQNLFVNSINDVLAVFLAKTLFVYLVSKLILIISSELFLLLLFTLAAILLFISLSPLILFIFIFNLILLTSL